MANTTQAKVLAIAPELSTIASDVWELVLDDVAADVPASYGAKQERAQRYLAAHYLTLARSDTYRNVQAAGPVVSESAGQVSVSYASGGFKDSNRYDETVYGRTFNQIRRSRSIGFQVFTP